MKKGQRQHEDCFSINPETKKQSIIGSRSSWCVYVRIKEITLRCRLKIKDCLWSRNSDEVGPGFNVFLVF
jgi:hypothetical protein